MWTPKRSEPEPSNCRILRRSERLPDDQAEVIFSDTFAEQLVDLTVLEREAVLADVVHLCESPWGKHALSGVLAGWNTLEVLERNKRVIFKVSVEAGVGLIDVLCLGPRSEDQVYDMAVGLIESGLLSDEEATSVWEALAIFDIVAERVGLDGWDYLPPPAPEGMRKTAVAAGLLTEEQAKHFSQEELSAALEKGWSHDGPDPEAAIAAALEAARRRAHTTELRDWDAVLSERSNDRCAVLLPRAGVLCIRRHGHPGPHRGSP